MERILEPDPGYQKNRYRIELFNNFNEAVDIILFQRQKLTSQKNGKSLWSMSSLLDKVEKIACVGLVLLTVLCHWYLLTVSKVTWLVVHKKEKNASTLCIWTVNTYSCNTVCIHLQE